MCSGQDETGKTQVDVCANIFPGQETKLGIALSLVFKNFNIKARQLIIDNGLTLSDLEQTPQVIFVNGPYGCYQGNHNSWILLLMEQMR